MQLRWERKCRVGNDRIDQEPAFLFQWRNEFDDAFAEKRDRSLMRQLSSRRVDRLVQQDTWLGAPLQNKKNDGAKSTQAA